MCPAHCEKRARVLGCPQAKSADASHDVRGVDNSTIFTHIETRPWKHHMLLFRCALDSNGLVVAALIFFVLSGLAVAVLSNGEGDHIPHERPSDNASLLVGVASSEVLRAAFRPGRRLPRT